MRQAEGKVISNTQVKPGFFLMEIGCLPVAREARPGQFLTIRCSGSSDPLLRRPFGFHKISGGKFRILYETVGRGTKAVSSMKPGMSLDVLGPLGNGFSVPKGERDFVIVAGGIGVAPLAALAEELLKDRKNSVSVIVGARDKGSLLCAEYFGKLGARTSVSTDDGSCGAKCFAVDLLEKHLAARKGRKPVVYACGPKPMLRAVARITGRRRLKAYGSFEEYIACGVGACLGCAIETKSGYKLICKDGPVFGLEEMIW